MRWIVMVAGESLRELRDHAILKFYVATGARIETGCRLNVSDFHQDGDEATVRFHIKGNRQKTKSIYFSAAESISEYIKAGGIDSGPLFRPRLNAPPGAPETVNHNRPPSYHIKEIFRIGTGRRDYSKPRDANRILRNKDLSIAAAQCPELRAFLNTIITLSGGVAI